MGGRCLWNRVRTVNAALGPTGDEDQVGSVSSMCKLPGDCDRGPRAAFHWSTVAVQRQTDKPWATMQRNLNRQDVNWPELRST